MQPDLSPTLRGVFATAGLSLPEGRIATVAQTLLIVRAGCAILATVDYGETEPAFRFQPPPPQVTRNAP